MPSDPSHCSQPQRKWTDFHSRSKELWGKKKNHTRRISETQDATLESLALSNNVFQMLCSQVPATPPAQDILTKENGPREPTSPQGTFPLRAGTALSPTAAMRQCKPTIVWFLSLFSMDFPKHSAANQASQGLFSETKHLSTREKPPEWGSFPFGQCLFTPPHSIYDYLQAKIEQKLLLVSSSALVLPWYCISRMLWDAPALTQPYQTR